MLRLLFLWLTFVKTHKTWSLLINLELTPRPIYSRLRFSTSSPRLCLLISRELRVIGSEKKTLDEMFRLMSSYRLPQKFRVGEV